MVDVYVRLKDFDYASTRVRHISYNMTSKSRVHFYICLRMFARPSYCFI